jgi:peptidoglycan hydrolase CwlO-like protein
VHTIFPSVESHTGTNKMFFSGIAIRIAIMVALAGGGVGAWFYVQNLRSELNLAAERQARMSDVIDSQKQVMDNIQHDVARMQKTQNELNTKLQEADQGRRDLEVKFNQTRDGKSRDFSALANKEPQRVEESINRGTHDANRCNELLTGAALTEDEKAGKVKNTMCPTLLPAYVTSAAASAAPTSTASTPAPTSSSTFDPSKVKRAK